MGYDSVAHRDDLNEAEKEVERERRRKARIDWVNTDINGVSIQERVERLEALVLGQAEPPQHP